MGAPEGAAGLPGVSGCSDGLHLAQGRETAKRVELGWGLLERGVASIVASDGHRPTRPPYLDGAYALAVRRLGEERALPMFDGTNLGVTTPSPLASPARSRDAEVIPTRSA